MNRITQQDKEHIDALYAGRTICFGDLHNHSASSPRSDGRRTLAHWKGALEALELDFAAILDHGQVEHMYLPDWEDGVFIGGTEPGIRLLDSPAKLGDLHYNMIFADAAPLEALLEAFPEYEFTGGIQGRFRYPDLTCSRFQEVITFVKEHGGFFVHPHPKQIMISENPLDYWFQDETGLEVFYDDMRDERSRDNYQLWCDILRLGKRVWATGGNDNHACARDTALTGIYVKEKKNAEYLYQLRKGDFVCGSVGIRMCIGDTPMGGQCDFAGKRLILCAEHFHRSVRNPEHTYRLDIYNENSLVCSEEFSCEEPFYFAQDAEDCRFYRAEVVDINQNLKICLGNPIWNLK